MDSPLITSDLDVYRSAWLMVQQHGDDTAIQAAMRANALLDQGDMEGRRVWFRIKEAIGELQRREAPASAVRH